MVDTLRADRTSKYGYDKLTTPHLDALGRRGVVFESAWSATPWTWPSTASILTWIETGIETCPITIDGGESALEFLQANGYAGGDEDDVNEEDE